MPNDKKSKNNKHIEPVMEEPIVEEENLEEAVKEELSDDVKEALGLQDDTEEKKKNVPNLTPELEYISDDIKDTLNEIEELM